jgi:type IV pilus assembly protein PilF
MKTAAQLPILFSLFVLLILAGCATSNGTAERAHNIAKVHTELAGSYFAREQYAISLQEVGIALQADPAYAPGYNVRGLVRMALHEDEQAEEDFKSSLKLEPESSEAHNNFGWFLCQRGRVHESIPQFTDALKNPLYATPEIANANAGICARKMGDLKGADAFLQRALILRPGMPEAVYGLAEVNFARMDYAVARSYFMRFQQSRQDLNAEQLWLAVRIERKMHDRNSEASYALQLSKRYPDSREAKLMQIGE